MNVPPRIQRWASIGGTLAGLAEMLFGLAEKFAHVMSDLDVPDLDPSGATVPGNVEGQIVEVVFTASGTDVRVAHGLKRTPRNVIPMLPRVLDSNGNAADAHVTLALGSVPPGDQVITVRCKFAAPATKVIARFWLCGGRRRRP